MTDEAACDKLEKSHVERYVLKMPKINFREDALYDVFIHQLVVDKGLDAEDRAQSGKISYELKTKLDEQLQKAMINALPDRQLEALGQLMDREASDDEIEKFFSAVAVDYPAVIQAEMVKFREEYLGKAQPKQELVQAQAQGAKLAQAQESKPEQPAENKLQGVVSEQTKTENPGQAKVANSNVNVSAEVKTESESAPLQVQTHSSANPAQPNAAASAQSSPVQSNEQSAQTQSGTQTAQAQTNTQPAQVQPQSGKTPAGQTPAATPPAGNPVQGTTSEVPGASDVNGKEQKATLMTEDKQ